MSEITIKITVSTLWGKVGTIRIDNMKHYWVYIDDSDDVTIPSLTSDNGEDKYLGQIKKHIEDNPGIGGLTNDDGANTIYYNEDGTTLTPFHSTYH